MSGWLLRQELCGRRRTQAAATVAAVGVAAASFGSVALGSSSATDREGRVRSVDLGEALAAGRDGKLVVAGLSRRGSPRGFALARYTTAGTLDRRFGTGGKVLTSFGGARSWSYAGATSLAIGPDGKIVLAGFAYVPPSSSTGFAIARYTVAGTLDRTFGRNGKVLTYFGSRRNASSAGAVAIQADGKVVAVGDYEREGRRLAGRQTRPLRGSSVGAGDEEVVALVRVGHESSLGEPCRPGPTRT